MTTYPVRCKLVENPHDGPARSEDGNPHVGEYGIADVEDGKVVITLDSGEKIADSDCWWELDKGRADEID